MRIAIRFGPDQASRSLALAHAFAELAQGSEILLATSGCPDLAPQGMKQVKIGASQFPSWDLEETESAVGDCDILVLDNAAGPQMQKALGRKARILAVVEDSPAGEWHADCVINPNLNAHLLDYANAGPEALLGTEFHALPPEFDEFADRAQEAPERCRKIAVHLGADRKGELLRLVRMMRGSKDNFIATICTGRDHPHGQALAAEIGLDSRFIVAESGARRLAQSDLAIVSESTLNEAVFFRLPALLLTGGGLAEYAVRSGLCLIGGESNPGALKGLMEDRGLRQRMSARMEDLVDGLGRYRIGEELLRLERKKEPG